MFCRDLCYCVIDLDFMNFVLIVVDVIKKINISLSRSVKVLQNDEI